MTTLGSAFKKAVEGGANSALASAVKKAEKRLAAKEWEESYDHLDRLMVNLEKDKSVYSKAVKIAKKLSEGLKSKKVNNNFLNLNHIHKLHGYEKDLRIAA